MPNPTYKAAVTVREFADGLIKDFHPHLTNVKIEYVFRSKAKKKNGHPITGIVSIVNGLPAWLSTPVDKRWEMPEPYFVLEIAEDQWIKLNETKQKATVDRYLYRMERDIDTGDLVIVPPDIEESTIIVRRHGLYNDDLKQFVKAGARQLTLLEIIEDREDLFNMGDKVTINYGEDLGVDVTRAELLAALAKLDVENSVGMKLDKALNTMMDEVNSGVLDTVDVNGEPITVTMSRSDD